MALMLEQPGFLWPALIAIALYGLRYLLLASLGFGLAQGWWGRPIGRVHIPRPSGAALSPQLRRELGHSALTVLIFGVVNAVLFGTGLVRHSRIYLDLHSHSMAWFATSVVLMLVLHDTFFYWLHRLMHTRALFARTHLLHHRSIHPTAYAAYSFSAAEALGEALIVVAIIFIVPQHPLAFLLFQSLSTAYNVYGHCGRELYPPGMDRHWLGRWLNTASLHAHHHRWGRGNYGLYFTFWDRCMGTLETRPPDQARCAIAD